MPNEKLPGLGFCEKELACNQQITIIPRKIRQIFGKHQTSSNLISDSYIHTLLCWQHIVSLLESHSLSRVLVIGRKSSRVSTLSDFTITSKLLKSVDSLALGIEGVHKMHFECWCWLIVEIIFQAGNFQWVKVLHPNPPLRES